MKTLICLNFVLLSFVSFAQKSKQEVFTVFYDAKQNEISEEEWNGLNDSVTSYAVVSKQGKIAYVKKFKTLNDRLISKGSYSDRLRTVKNGTWYYYNNDTLTKETNYEKGRREGLSTDYYPSGKVHFLSNYQGDKLHGSFKSLYESGAIKREDFYTYGNFESGKCFDEQGNEVEYYDLLIDAQFVGGQEAMNLYLKEKMASGYAYDDIEKSKVVVRFMVGKDGSVSNLKIVKSGTPYLDELSSKVVSEMPKWIPAMYDGELVEMWFNLPLSFK